MRSLLEVCGVALLSVAVTAGCNNDSAETDSTAEVDIEAAIDEATELSQRPCPEESYLSYDNFGGPFLLSWCAGCHSSALGKDERQEAPISSNFDDLELIRASAARMWARSGDHNATMPPVGGPDDEQRRLFGEWLACGAPADEE